MNVDEPVSQVIKKRGRPPGSKNSKKRENEDVVNAIAPQAKRRAVKRVAAVGVIPTVAELIADDISNEYQVPDMAQMSRDQLMAISTATQNQMIENLYGMNSGMSQVVGMTDRVMIVESSSHVCGVDVWPQTTKKPCWHCRRRIKGVPMRHCKSIEWSEQIKKDTYVDVYGWWCNPQCLRKYLETQNVPNIGHELVIVSKILIEALGMTMEETEGCAPPWQAHVDADGFMTDKEFDEASKASSGIRIVCLDKRILQPSALLFEITKRQTAIINGSPVVDPSIIHAPMMTQIGLELNTETGRLHDTHGHFLNQLDTIIHETDKRWPKFKATGYSFQTTYALL